MAADTRRAARARIRRARIRSFAPLLVAVAVLGAGALVAIPLGGWDEVELVSERVPQIEPGETFTSTPFAVAVHSIALIEEHPDGYTEAEPGETWMILEATFENRLEFPQRPPGMSGFQAFSIEGLDLEAFGSVDTYLDRDDTFLPTLNPGIPDDVNFVFAVPEDQYADGDVVTVALWDAERQRAELYSGIRWWRPHVAVEVPVVVEDRR